MKKIFLLIIWIFSTYVYSVSFNTDTITKKIIWQDTIFINRNILIEENGELVILPGTKIIFEDAYSITITGTGCIKANGTKTDTIFFKTKDDNTKWNGIFFIKISKNAEKSSFNFCFFPDF